MADQKHLPSCIICDIDGTVADITHRLPHIQKVPKDWVSFNAAAKDDKLIQHIAYILRTMAPRVPIVYTTGRVELMRGHTIQWMVKSNLPGGVPGALFMRKDGDFRDDAVIKEEILDRDILPRWSPLFALEDRNRVVTMWRRRGIPCLQVAEGDF